MPGAKEEPGEPSTRAGRRVLNAKRACRALALLDLLLFLRVGAVCRVSLASIPFLGPRPADSPTTYQRTSGSVTLDLTGRLPPVRPDSWTARKGNAFIISILRTSNGKAVRQCNPNLTNLASRSAVAPFLRNGSIGAALETLVPNEISAMLPKRREKNVTGCFCSFRTDSPRRWSCSTRPQSLIVVVGRILTSSPSYTT
jgi:hypothetical protein